MAMVSYLLGRYYYPVAYDVIRVLGYITLGVGLYIARAHLPAASGWQQPWLMSAELMLIYLLVTMLFEGRQLVAIVKRERCHTVDFVIN